MRVGLTGGIGSGKSLVARIFSTLGVPVFEADARAKALMTDDPQVRAALIELFGPDVYGDDALDRALLASKVFGNAERLAALNAIVHPAVRKAFSIWAEEQTAPYVIMEAAIMAENEGYRSFDRVIVVNAPEELRIQRVIARDGIDEEAVRARMQHQATEEQRQAIAQFAIVNDDTVLVIPQVLAIHEQLLNLAAK